MERGRPPAARPPRTTPARRARYFAPWPVVERKANPAVAARNAAMTQINALGSRFGLNPSAASYAGRTHKGAGAAQAGNGDPNPFGATG